MCADMSAALQTAAHSNIPVHADHGVSSHDPRVAGHGHAAPLYEYGPASPGHTDDDCPHCPMHESAISAAPAACDVAAEDAPPPAKLPHDLHLAALPSAIVSAPAIPHPSPPRTEYSTGSGRPSIPLNVLHSFDSWSVRATWNPTGNWPTQLSFCSLEEPESLDPGVDMDRTTLSTTYHRPLAAGWWQTTLAVGRNEKQSGESTEAWLLESALRSGDATTVFARAESVDKDELFLEGDPLHHQLFRVKKLGIGAARDFGMLWDGVLSAGVVYNLHVVLQALEPSYGGDLESWLVFLRWALP